MPGDLSISDLDDETVLRLRQRAARNGQSAETEARTILRTVLADDQQADFAQLAAELRKLTANRRQTPAEILQREGRDER